MARDLDSAKLAQIIFLDTVLDITFGENAGKVTAKDCLDAISGRNGPAIANSLNDETGTVVLLGETSVSKLLQGSDGFGGRTTNAKELQRELTKRWTSFVALDGKDQIRFAEDLQAWVLSNGGERSVPRIGKEY